MRHHESNRSCLQAPVTICIVVSTILCRYQYKVHRHLVHCIVQSERMMQCHQCEGYALYLYCSQKQYVHIAGANELLYMILYSDHINECTKKDTGEYYLLGCNVL
jgi:hypothetical protein